MTSDHELISRVAQHDRAAFDELYERHASKLLGILASILSDRNEAEDVLQDVFWQVWTRAANFDANRASAKAWLVMMTRSRAIDRIRRRKEYAASDSIEASISDVSAERLDRAEWTGRVNAAIRELPQEQQRVLRLAFYDGLSHEQIARQQAIPLGTVKTRIRSAMMRLREACGIERSGAA